MLNRASEITGPGAILYAVELYLTFRGKPWIIPLMENCRTAFLNNTVFL